MIRRIKRKDTEKKGRYAVYSMNQVYDTGWGFILPPKALNLYMYLKTFLNDRSRICNPAQETILTNLHINKDNLVASIEFLNIIGFINVVNGNYKYNIPNKYEMLDIPTLNSTILNKSFLLVLREILVKREQRPNKSDRNKYKRGITILDEAIEKANIQDIRLTYEIKTEKGYRIREDGTRKSPKEKMESNKTNEKLAQRLAQGIYNIILTTSRNEDNYNNVVNNFLVNEIPSGDNETPEGIDNLLGGEANLSEGYNIQFNTPDNTQSITDDESFNTAEINIPNFEDVSISIDERVKPFSKVEKLLKDIEGLLVKFKVSGEQLDCIVTILEEKDSEYLEEVSKCFTILIDGEFIADDIDNYAWSVCNNPNIKAAEGRIRGIKNRKSKNDKVVKSNRIEPTSRDYYDKVFGI